MKPIKKFSTIAKAGDSINESADANHDAVMDLVKKMGYESIDELKKEKNLLTKLEGLLKDFTPKQDISEDELEEDRADDIEDDVKKKGEPRSLEGTKDKGSDEEAVDAEVEEDADDDLVSDEEEITMELPAEADEVEDEEDVEVASEEKETPAATRRIMAFEDFIKETTVNKNISYRNDDEEEEDYSVVAASADPLAEGDESKGKEDEKEGDELEDKGDKKVDSEDDKEKADHYAGAVKSDDSEIDALKKDVEFDEEEEDDAAKKESRVMSFTNFVTEAYNKDDEDFEEEDDSVEEDRAEDIEDEINAKGKPKTIKEGVGEVITKVEGDEIADEEAGADGIAIPAEKGDGSETAAGIAGDIMNMGKVKVQPKSKGEELVTKDQKITTTIKGEASDLSDATVVVKEAKLNEAEITSDDQFKEYAMKMLKDAFGSDFDEAKATDVADGLIKKYAGDYGAMVGALQSTMGS